MQRTFYVWQEAGGHEFYTYGDAPSNAKGALTLLRTFEAKNFLEAEFLMSGEEVDIDPGIRSLVELINDIPGLMTVGSCEGHIQRRDTYAVVEFVADDVASIRRLARFIQFIDQDAYPLKARIGLLWDQTSYLFDLPQGALHLELQIFATSRSGKDKPPSREQLASVVQGIAESIAAEHQK